jgi:ATP-dependent DNA helicase RecG
LSPSIYREFGQLADYVRQAGFDEIQQEHMVLQYVEKHGRITRKDAVALCKIGPYQASRLLKRLSAKGDLRREGERKSAFYERAHKMV